MRGIGLERQVAQFVDDQQLRFRELGQLLLKPTLSMRLGKLGDQRRSGHEQDRVAGRDGLAADRHRQVLPTPGGPRSRSASPFAMKRPVASSRTWLLSIEVWSAKSK